MAPPEVAGGPYRTPRRVLPATHAPFFAVRLVQAERAQASAAPPSRYQYS